MAITFAFAIGWYLAISTKAKDLSSVKSALGRASMIKKKRPPSASEIAQAQARLAQTLHAHSVHSSLHEMLDYIASLDEGMVKALLDDLKDKPLTPSNTQALIGLMSRWAELDPGAALSWMDNIKNPSSKSICQKEIFDVLFANNPNALGALAQLKGNPGISSAIFATFQNLAKQNPQTALNMLRSLPAGQQSSQLYSTIFQTWASKDPSAASDTALNLPPSFARSQSLDVIASTWTLQDPTAAFAWAKTLPIGPTQDGAVAASILALSKQDPITAADEVANLTDGPNRDALLQNVASNWAQKDPAGLLDWANGNLAGESYQNVAISALSQLGNTDPTAAATYLAQNPDPYIASQVIPELAYSWAHNDPQSALVWAQSLPTDDVANRNAALTGVVSIWTHNNAAATATYIQQNFANDPAFSTLVTQVAGSWGLVNPQAALTWAENLPSGDAQNNAIASAITSLAKSDPQTAWNDAQQLSGSSGYSAQVNVISIWASQQPAQAAAALANLPQGSDLDTATADVAKNWLNQDPAAASDWINTLPQGAARDSAIGQIIATVGKNDPASAFTWATSISDPSTRNTQVVELATQWSTQNSAAAAAAVQNALNSLTGLTSAQQTALQEIVDNATAH